MFKRIRKNLLKLVYLILNLILLSKAVYVQKEMIEDEEQARRFVSFVDVGSTIYYQSICLPNDLTHIKMECTGSDRIKILKTVYGYNPGYALLKTVQADLCSFSVTDCTYDKEFSIDNACTGRNTCLVKIEKSKIINESLSLTGGRNCKDFNYVQINYQCLPNLPTKDICGVNYSELSHAYITTPNFPDKIKAKERCECTLESNFEFGQILLRRVDMKLPNSYENQQCGAAFLDILENNKGADRKCGYMREAGSIFGSGASRLKLNFATSDMLTSSDNGFWLEILASPPRENHKIVISCNKGKKAQVDNSNLFAKLKNIHEKLKRLNKTINDSLDKKKLIKLTKNYNDSSDLFHLLNEKKKNPTFLKTSTANKSSRVPTALLTRKAARNDTILTDLNDDLIQEFFSKNFKTKPGRKSDQLNFIKLNKILNKQFKNEKKENKLLLDIGSKQLTQKIEKNIKSENGKLIENSDETLNDQESFIREMDSLDEELDLSDFLFLIQDLNEQNKHLNKETTTATSSTQTKNSPTSKLDFVNNNEKNVSDVHVAHLQQAKNDASSISTQTPEKLTNEHNNASQDESSYKKIGRNLIRGKILKMKKRGTEKGEKRRNFKETTNEEFNGRKYFKSFEWLQPLQFEYEIDQNFNFLNQTTTKVTKKNNKFKSKNTQVHNNKTNALWESCERNSTKLISFYGPNDYLMCEKTSNQTLECIDEILLTKLILKLNPFYYIQLQPLYIQTDRLDCSSLNESLFNHSKNLPDELSQIRNTLICTQRIKNDTGRRKLIWSLFLILRNQSCFSITKSTKSKPSTLPPPSLIHLNNFKPLEENSSLNQSKMNKTNSQFWSQFSQSVMFRSNRFFLVMLISSSAVLVLLANMLMFLIYKFRKHHWFSSDFSKSMTMNNRLLQNYLDLKINPDEKISTAVSKSNMRDKQCNEYGTKCHSSNFFSIESQLKLKESSEMEQERRRSKRYEIDRIPSLKKSKYSMSTVATQADLDSGSFYVERKDFKYRNQEMSDVESQILSIEMDLCSDIYASLSNDINCYQKIDNYYFDLQDLTNFNNELAKIKVNESTAYKNSLNFQNSNNRLKNNFFYTLSLKTDPTATITTTTPKNNSQFKFDTKSFNFKDTLNSKGSVVRLVNDDLTTMLSLKNLTQSSFNSTLPITYTSSLLSSINNTNTDYYETRLINDNNDKINNLNDLVKFDEKIYEAYRKVLPIGTGEAQSVKKFKIAYLDTATLKTPFKHLINSLSKKREHLNNSSRSNKAVNCINEKKNEDSSDIYYHVENESQITDEENIQK